MPWVMISPVMSTMWAWRMRRRLTTSVICMREWVSLGWASTAKIEACELSMSSSTSAGMAAIGRGASASRTKAFHVQPTRSSSATIDAAICMHASSVMRVTFSAGPMCRQVVTALRAPVEYSGGKGTRRRSKMGSHTAWSTA